MKRFLHIAILSLVTTALLGPSGPGTAQAGDDATFSNRDIRGPYGFSFDGFVAGEEGWVPAAAVGQFDADGAGTFPVLTRTLNVGGAVGTQLFENGVYNVNGNGTGFACFCGNAPTPIPGVPPLLLPTGHPFPPTFETFSFVITGAERDRAEFVGVTLRFITVACPLDEGISCPPTSSPEDQQILEDNLAPAELSLSVVNGFVRSQSSRSGRDDDDD